MRDLSAEYLDVCRSQMLKEQAVSLSETANWSHVDRDKVHADWDKLYKELTPWVGKASPASPEIQAFMARHHEIVSRFYPPSKEAYIGMALYYEENQDMKNFHDSYHPNLVPFLKSAIVAYAMR